MNIPDDLRYTREHEWARVAGDRAKIGITDHAQEELGDIVYVELPKVGDTLRKDSPFGVVESVKSVSDLFAPLSGEVVAVNEALADRPETVNEDPYGEGWMVEIQLTDPSEADDLLDADGYRALVE